MYTFNFLDLQDQLQKEWQDSINAWTSRQTDNEPLDKKDNTGVNNVLNTGLNTGDNT